MEAVDNHARPDRIITQAVDDDEGAGRSVFAVGIKGDPFFKLKRAAADFVQPELPGRLAVQGIDIHAVADLANHAGRLQRGVFNQVVFARPQRLFGHPHHHGLEAVRLQRPVVRVDQKIASADIDFVLQGQGHGQRRARLVEFSFKGEDRLDPARLMRRQHHDFVARPHDPGRNCAAIAAEIGVRTVDVLDRQSEVDQIQVRCNMHVFQQIHQGCALIPRHGLAFGDHIIALQGGQGQKADIAQLQPGGKGRVVGHDGVKHLLAVADEVHLIDRHNDVLDAEQRGDKTVATGLGQHAMARIDQNNGQVTGRRPGRHIARVLLVAGRVGDNEFPPGG